jgi:diacylglycerol kinase (ATP)
MSVREEVMKKFLMGFRYAGRGIVAGLIGQLNINVMLALAAMAIALGVIFSISTTEWALLAGLIGLVLSLELVNTAGEKLVDILSPEQNERYGQIKDILAGAVLVAALAAGVAGLLIFLPKWL